MKNDCSELVAAVLAFDGRSPTAEEYQSLVDAAETFAFRARLDVAELRIAEVQAQVNKIVGRNVASDAVLSVIHDAATWGTGILHFRDGVLTRIDPATVVVQFNTSMESLAGVLASVGIDVQLPKFRDLFWNDPIFHALAYRLRSQQEEINRLKRRSTRADL